MLKFAVGKQTDVLLIRCKEYEETMDLYRSSGTPGRLHAACGGTTGSHLARCRRQGDKGTHAQGFAGQCRPCALSGFQAGDTGAEGRQCAPRGSQTADLRHSAGKRCSHQTARRCHHLCRCVPSDRWQTLSCHPGVEPLRQGDWRADAGRRAGACRCAGGRHFGPGEV